MKFLGVLLVAVLAFSAHAGTQCTSKLTGVSLQPNGAVFLPTFGSWKWLYVCSVNKESNNTNANSCQAIYSMLLAAHMSDKRVSFWFNNGRNCEADSQTAWGVMQDWYFGPLIHKS